MVLVPLLALALAVAGLVAAVRVVRRAAGDVEAAVDDLPGVGRGRGDQ